MLKIKGETNHIFIFRNWTILNLQEDFIYLVVIDDERDAPTQL